MALLILCPECEAGAVTIEIGGNLLEAAHAYYEGGGAVEEHNRNVDGLGP